MLTRADGPPCTKCGCEDTEITADPIPVPVTWPTPGRARCSHCGTEFRFMPDDSPSAEASADADPEPPPATPPPILSPETGKVQCPDCGSGETAVYRTMPAKDGELRTRYRRCHGCGARFKTET